MNSTTLQVGDRAPQFSLKAGNSGKAFTLESLLANGPVVIEFLRGTW